MKKVRVFAIAMALVMGLAVTIFAVGRVATKAFAHNHAASCCAKHGEKHDGKASCDKDTCPMKDGDCCKNQDACPMKKQAASANYENTGAVIENASETKVCHKKAAMQSAEHKSDCCQDGASCCNGGACCKKDETTAKL